MALLLMAVGYYLQYQELWLWYTQLEAQFVVVWNFGQMWLLILYYYSAQFCTKQSTHHFLRRA